VESADIVNALVAEVEQIHVTRSKQLLLVDIMAEAGRNPVIADILQAHTKASKAFWSICYARAKPWVRSNQAWTLR